MSVAQRGFLSPPARRGGLTQLAAPRSGRVRSAPFSFNLGVIMRLLRGSQSRRTLCLERLEDRNLLAGDTYLVNFQNDEASTPSRYLRDSGEVFGVRTSGFSYGWSADHTDRSVERSVQPDQRLDTFIQFEAGQVWEISLENGSYEVTIAVGDPADNDAVHTINVEGVGFWNAEPDVGLPLVETRVVTITDGRLTIDAGSSATGDTRINYAHIVGISTGGNSPPSMPFVTEPATDGQVVNPFDVHMEAIGFSDPDGDAHKSSDWEIWTVGASPEPVWQTLGIEGVERLHTHLGDGIFLNRLAGASALAGETEYQLRVRFRDDAGSVSGYDLRNFRTDASSIIFPLEVQDVETSPTPTWVDSTGTPIDLVTGPPLLSPGDDIIAVDLDGNSSYPGNETPQDAIDRTAAKYLNFGEVNSGFIVTPSVGSSLVRGFQITTGNDAEERDPSAWALFGTNAAISSIDNSRGTAESWTLIDSGVVSLPGARNTPGPIVTVAGSTSYASYRMIFTDVKNSATANSMQFTEIQFFGEPGGGGAMFPSLRLESAQTGDRLLTIEGDSLPGNRIINPAALQLHAPVRIVVEAGSNDLFLTPSDLQFTSDSGRVVTIFLPQINLMAGERADFWVASSGATYFGTPAQSAPDFSFLARPDDLTISFIATRPGFVIEEVSADYRLPVNIAFVPNPGPDPDDPLYYITELYGSIQVVTRDGTKHEFATGLLDYNPEGPISGSGEQGLTGIAVERDQNNPEIYHLYVGMLWDNGAPPGGAAHYPKVERISSMAGGLALGSRTVLLNMQPEVQGQSHQISNITIGPDGKLYVHNGDGFNASTAQNLNSFRGKILRMNLDGTAPADNPFYDASNGINARDYVYAYGLRNPFGGAWRSSDGKHYEVENGPTVDRFAQINAGVNYGWDGSNASMQINAIYNWDPAHAPVNLTFIEEETFGGSQFPAELRDRAFISESGPTYAEGSQALGKRISEFHLDGNGDLVGGPESLIEYIGLGRSTVAGLAAGPDGLYFTELYEDSGDNGPTATGARIYRVRYVNPLQGDYDIDGDVDHDDLDVWRDTYGSNLLLAADGDGNGVVDSVDYAIWREAFGAAVNNAAIRQSATVAARPAAISTSTLAAPADADSDIQLDVATAGVGFWLATESSPSVRTAASNSASLANSTAEPPLDLGTLLLAADELERFSSHQTYPLAGETDEIIFDDSENTDQDATLLAKAFEDFDDFWEL